MAKRVGRRQANAGKKNLSKAHAMRTGKRGMRYDKRKAPQ